MKRLLEILQMQNCNHFLVFAAVLCLLLAGNFSLYAQAQVNAHAQEFVFNFPFGKSTIEKTYMSNKESLAQFEVFVKNMDLFVKNSNDSGLQSVVIETSVSPDGSDVFSNRVEAERGEVVMQLLRRTLPGLPENIVVVNHLGENWDALRRMVVEDTSISSEMRSSILRILDSWLTPVQKKSCLFVLPGWKDLWPRYYPSLRFASIRFTYNVAIPAPQEEVEVAAFPELPELDLNIQIPEYKIVIPRFTRLNVSYKVKPIDRKRPSDATRNTWFAVNTNLLYDAVTALNVEIEAPVANRFSVLWEDVFPWWEFSKNKYCFGMWEMGPEVRFWFKKWDPVGTEKLRGWFVGLYGMSARYDVQWDRDIDYQGEYWSVGVSGGYALPLGKNKNWRLAFSLALGYLSTDYRHFLPTDSYDKLIRDPYQVGTLTYFGPTKLKVVLSMPVNFKVKKGGER